MKTLALVLLLTASRAWADPSALLADHRALLRGHRIGPLAQQSFCYLKDGAVEGHQTSKVQRIASLTKILTTLLASETMDLSAKFKTTVHIGNDHLHIEGGGDPFFEEEKLLLLMRALNDLGHTSFKKVTFNSAFLFSDASLGSHADITLAHTRSRLAVYFNSKNKKFLRSKWNTTLAFAQEEGVYLEGPAPSLSVKAVAYSEKNPLADENAAVWTHTSRPFHDILKSMNVMSKNLVAQNVFLTAQKIRTLKTVLTEFGIPEKEYKIYNGSGLPVIWGRHRADNLGSCSMMLRAITHLEESLRKHGLVLTDVLAVNGGQDLGSFRTRFERQTETHEAVISKTGTLKHTSSLAGVLTMSEHVPFAILNHTTNITGARKFQDELVARMFQHLEPAVPVPYAKISIFPWDGNDFLEPRE